MGKLVKCHVKCIPFRPYYTADTLYYKLYSKLYLIMCTSGANYMVYGLLSALVIELRGGGP